MAGQLRGLKSAPSPGDGTAATAAPQLTDKFFARDLLGPDWGNKARLSDDMLQHIMVLPGTKSMTELRHRADQLSSWKLALQRGILPKNDVIDWPQEPFKTKFADALRELEMPRFTRRYPAVLDTLLRQMLALIEQFEEKMEEYGEEVTKTKTQQEVQEQVQQEQQEQQEQDTGSQGQQGQQGEGGEGDNDDQDMQEQMQQAMQQAQSQAPEEQEGDSKDQKGQGKGKGQMQAKLDSNENNKDNEKDKNKDDQDMTKQLDKIAEDIVKNFQQQMAPVMENLEKGEAAFDDLNALMDGSEGFDLSKGTWKRSGWTELDQLRKVLEQCPELRDLVRQLGRGGGKGPLRRAPEELEAKGHPAGVIRSPLQPEEVFGLTRSGELSRMLPSEMALLAHGWPRKGRGQGGISSEDEAGVQGGARHARKGAAPARGPPAQQPDRHSSSWGRTISSDGGSQRRSPTPEREEEDADLSVSSGEFDLQEYYLPGAHAARMLHRVRRAERMLLSYERTGWLEDVPARITDRREIRPAAELGPIILCLDTSGSMKGARETVAKALALECLRGAHRQRRACYLYAFSGPSEVQELELKVDVASLDKLLEFLSCSFSGGTDVDAPLKLSLERLGRQEWEQADILMVTDGEIPSPDQVITDTIDTMHRELGLEVHGLLVASKVSEPMRLLCTHTHIFKSWTAVGGETYAYT